MKKIIISFIGLIVLFIVILYLSLWSTDDQFKTCDLLNIEDINTIDFTKYDSVLVATSTLYKANGIKKLMQGEHYRKAWSTPISVPVVFLDTLHGGMEILEEGGGKQTHSLDLKSKNGTLYTLRSINKDPKPLVPELAKKLGLENIVVDGISAQHPYAALVVAQLAEAVNIPHTNPTAVFVPKQPLLGKINEKYGNRLYLLEYESEGKVNWTRYKHIKEIIDTDDLQELKQEQKNVYIDTNALVRARLFDLIIGDWDRHAKQWGWAIQKKDSAMIALPIPADRDNAFFALDGIIPKLIASEFVNPELRSLEDRIDYLPGLVKRFDRYFLLNVPDSIFVEEAIFLKEHLTDTTIANAFKVWPKKLYELDGDEIIKKLKSRRKKIVDYALLFANEIKKQGFISKPLTGSEDLELSSNLSKCFDCN